MSDAKKNSVEKKDEVYKITTDTGNVMYRKYSKLAGEIMKRLKARKGWKVEKS